MHSYRFEVLKILLVVAHATGGREASGGSSRKQQTMNYYTDDSPGLKISPVRSCVLKRSVPRLSRRGAGEIVGLSSLLSTSCLVVLPQVVVIGMSIGFICFVAVLHVIAKVSSRRSAFLPP